MSRVQSERRPGAYYDSIVLMRLQSSLAKLSGVVDAGVVMATAANLALLESNGLLPPGAEASPDDLLIVVKAESDAAAAAALAQVDPLLARRRAAAGDDYRPRALATAVKMLPEASWVLISVPGRYAAEVASQALESGLNVFLYSDNVSLADEVALKRSARSRGLLVMGPDCGTAIISGVGMGFANRVQRGSIGLIGASGTGLQAVTCAIDRLGAGVSQAIGTGGRDLHGEVEACTALQGLDLLARDDATEVIVLVSKPPSSSVASRLLDAAHQVGKPVVVEFMGYPAPGKQLGRLHFASGLEEAAILAVGLMASRVDETQAVPAFAGMPSLVRGLFAGGTLAYEALLGLRTFLTPLFSNISLGGVEALAKATESQGHTVLDLGEDAYTVGRLHPMMDQELRLRRLRQEAADPEVGLILLDVVLGFGAHSDPASELAPAIEEILGQREIEILVIVVGTADDPQDLEAQVDRLSQAGARVFSATSEAVAYIHRRHRGSSVGFPPVALESLTAPMAAINIGLETFHEALIVQGAAAVQVEWRPPAGGDERLMALLRKMSGRPDLGPAR